MHTALVKSARQFQYIGAAEYTRRHHSEPTRAIKALKGLSITQLVLTIWVFVPTFVRVISGTVIGRAVSIIVISITATVVASVIRPLIVGSIVVSPPFWVGTIVVIHIRLTVGMGAVIVSVVVRVPRIRLIAIIVHAFQL